MGFKKDPREWEQLSRNFSEISYGLYYYGVDYPKLIELKKLCEKGRLWISEMKDKLGNQMADIIERTLIYTDYYCDLMQYDSRYLSHPDYVGYLQVLVGELQTFFTEIAQYLLDMKKKTGRRYFSHHLGYGYGGYGYGYGTLYRYGPGYGISMFSTLPSLSSKILGRIEDINTPDVDTSLALNHIQFYLGQIQEIAYSIPSFAQNLAKENLDNLTNHLNQMISLAKDIAADPTIARDLVYVRMKDQATRLAKSTRDSVRELVPWVLSHLNYLSEEVQKIARGEISPDEIFNLQMISGQLRAIYSGIPLDIKKELNPEMIKQSNQLIGKIQSISKNSIAYGAGYLTAEALEELLSSGNRLNFFSGELYNQLSNIPSISQLPDLSHFTKLSQSLDRTIDPFTLKKAQELSRGVQITPHMVDLTKSGIKVQQPKALSRQSMRVNSMLKGAGKLLTDLLKALSGLMR